MIKIHCDRCGKEIKNKYYTINFNSYDADPQYDYNTTCYATGYSTNSREGVLKMLNSQKMYCEDCKKEIEKFISNC